MKEGSKETQQKVKEKKRANILQVMKYKKTYIL